MIPVNKPFLPPVEDYKKSIEGIWQRAWLTNNGPLVNELELELKHYLSVPYVLYTANGTLALQMAIRALDLKGEVITTPYSFVATANSIVWEGCKPVMVDIDPGTLNIDPQKIEAAITPNTTAIVATHVFGNPCDIEAIEKIGEKHGLKVIYDAAHCFGTNYKGKSVFSYGDITTTSFHATKLFHTVEGGAVFTKNAEMLKKIAFMRNFGLDGYENIACIGINAKNSEFHAAMGLANLKYAFKLIEKRKQDYLYYSQLLQGLKKEEQVINKNAEINYAYYPIMLPSEEILKGMVELLNANSIFPRRYFYPSLNTLPYIDQMDCPHAMDIAKRTLCLPLYYELSKEEIHFVVRILLRAQNN